MDLIVKNVKKISANYILINFLRPNNFYFEAGQWIDIKFALEEFPVKKIFSIASSPTESDILLLCKIGFSRYKKLLENVKVGDKLIIDNFGGNLTFTEKYSYIFIAGGVGIAPFRGAIKYLIDKKIKNQVTLIHLNTHQYFPFRDEFESWKKSYPNFRPLFVKTNGHKLLSMYVLQDILQPLIEVNHNIFYIAGPLGLVTNCQNLLEHMGIQKIDIKTEGFPDNENEAPFCDYIHLS